MSSQIRKPKTSAVPDKEPRGLEQAIAQLRNALGLKSQEELAAKLGVSRIAVLHWVNGRSKPKTENYIQLAKLAKGKSPALAFWFWRQLGLDLADLGELVPEIKKSLVKFERDLRKGGKTVTIPVLHDVTHVDEPMLTQMEGTESICIPTELLNLGAARCVRAPDDHMRPMFGRGDFVVIDASTRNPKELAGEIVAAYRISEGQGKPLPAGLYIRWLRAVGDNVLLVARQELRATKDQFADPSDPAASERIASLAYQLIETSAHLAAHTMGTADIQIGDDPDWRILGRVVCWIGCAPAKH